MLIDIAKNATSDLADYEPLPREEHIHNGRLKKLREMAGPGLQRPEPDLSDINTLVDMINQAEQPLVLVGAGSRGRPAYPLAGAVPEIPPLCADAPLPRGQHHYGRRRTAGQSSAVHRHDRYARLPRQQHRLAECDLLVAIGCRFSDRVTCDVKSFCPKAKIVHIDIDRAEIDKNVKTDNHIIGDARRVLELLNERISEKHYPGWTDYVLSHRDPLPPHNDSILQPNEILETIQKVDTNAIIATDVGQHQMWSCQYFHFHRPGQLLTSGGFGTMGFGLGAAIGAKLGNPDTTVVHCTGDGSFRMNCNELATVSCYHLPVITVIFNNRTLGMVRQWQNLIYDKRFSETDMDRGPDFVKLAEAYGIEGTRAATQAEFEAAFRRAVQSQRPWVIECAIDKDAMVHPMVSGGDPVTNFLLD